jgi:carbon-monoxide dehydrogenase medium subunit
MTTLAPFEVHRAGSVAEAGELLTELGPGAVVYSGGTELLLLMKLGFAAFDHLVDIKPIEELGQLEADADVLRIGGTVTHRRVERSAAVAERWPDLVEMERVVANVRVRNVGSLGGNLAFADPHSDPATFLLAAGASVSLGRGAERRSLPLSEFVLGPYETALEPGELLCAVEVPAPAPSSAMAHLRFAFHERPAATVSAQVTVAPDRKISEARVAVGSVGAVPVVVPGADEALVGQPALDMDRDVLAALGEAGATASEPVTDSNGSDDYKHALVRTLIGRALGEAARRASERGTD